MAYLIIRFFPTESMNNTDFDSTIANLEIDFYDISFNNLNPTTPIGSFTGAASIDQRGSDSVATGVFSLSPGGNEFDSLDLRVVVKRTTTQNQQTVVTVLLDTILGYNIELESDIPDNRHKAKPGAYIFLPPKDAKLSSLFPKPGEPWNYTNLRKALLNNPSSGDSSYNGVLFKETNNENYDLSTLTLAECAHLAREIATGERDNYPPIPNEKTWKLYTIDGTLNEEDVKEKFYNARVQLLSNIESHKKREEARTKELTHYIWALACAEWAAKESDSVQDILFRFPIQLPNLGSEEINIVNLSSGLMRVPAEFHYVYGIKIPVEIDKEKRFAQIKTEEQDVLLNLFEKAEEEGIADLAGTGKTSPQVIRLLRAQHTNRPSLPTIDLTAGTYGNPDLKVEVLVTSWSNYTGPDSLGFWSGALTPVDLEGHSELVMFLFSQGNAEFFDYLDGRFENIEIAGGTNSLLDINDDDQENTKDEWKTLYQDYLSDVNTVTGDSGIDFLPPGTIPERTDYFAIYACDFFGNLAASTTDYSLDVSLRVPPVFSKEIGPIQKFINAFIAAHGSLDELSDPDKADPVIADCFPDDACGQEWLRNKAAIFSSLYQLTNGIVDDCFTDEIRLTVWETLYALGITEKSQVQSMSLENFRACVAGTILDGPRDFTIETVDTDTQEVTIETVVCDIGELIHGNAAFGPMFMASGFTPINPGDLVNCIPPEQLTKTGRFAYLQDLLAFKIGDKTVSELLLETRGLHFGELLVSEENAKIKIPRVDVLNGLLEGMLCSPDAPVGNWDAHHFTNLLSDFKGLTIAVKKQIFMALETALPSTLQLSTIIRTFGSSTYNLTGVQGYIANLCETLDTAFANGNFVSFNDLVAILNDLSPTNLFAAILLDFIAAMIDMDDAQFDQEVSQVLDTMGTFPNNPVTELLTYLIQSVDQPAPQAIGIGNSGFQFYKPFIPKEKENDSAFLQEISQSIPPVSSLTEAACAYEILAESTAAPCKLPYHRPLAVSRAYLSALGTTRFDLARKFSRQIHGFAYDLNPDNTPDDFKSHLFRYPVNHELALEYLNVSPEEYSLFYEQTPLPADGDPVFHELLGYDSANDLSAYSNLQEFLKKNCLECCDFECWLNAGIKWLQIRNINGEVIELDCRDCDLHNYRVDVLEGAADPDDLRVARLWRLTMLIRLAGQLKKAGAGCYSCSDLALITNKLDWISIYYEDKDDDGIEELHTAIDPHFLEQFVALDQLRKECGVCFQVPSEADNPVYLTDLLAGPSGANWEAALAYFVEKIVEKCNEGKAPEACRSPQFIKLLVEHIDLLATLAGFRSDTDDFYKWYYQFTNIIRFAQALCRICDSAFTVGQLQFIFTADGQLVGDDPYPQQTRNEALEYPFHLPDNMDGVDLASLREKLLNIEPDQAEIDSWTWSKIDAHLRTDFGYTGNSFLEMGKRFFPKMLESLGYSISNTDLQFQEALADANTAQLMWNTGDVDPFFYIPGFLTCKIPLKSTEVIQKLQTIRQLNPDEENALQNLFFAPRLALTPFAAFFENFTEALSILIETEEESSRWKYFQKNFALFYKKCSVIVKHFTEHIADELGRADLDERVTWKMLAHLQADDHLAAQPWENDLGTFPAMTYPDKIRAGAFAALTKLSGAGLKGVFKNVDGKIIWREIRGGTTAYGLAENLSDHPAPTVIPNLSFTPQNAPLIAVVRNGVAFTKGSPSQVLGGAQGYTAEYKGVLYIPESGKYTFRAGAPTGLGEIPDFDQAKHSQWQLILQRGHKEHVVLDNDWNAPDTPGDCSVTMNLKKGAYDLCFTFKQPEPSLQNMEDGCPQPTGWQIKWTTPYQPEWHTIPMANLYHKAPYGDLSEDVQLLHNTATAFLKDQYQASVSGIRRTAIRSFAGGLLLHGGNISAAPISDAGLSELDYLLSNPSLFAGFSHYEDSGIWKTHLTGFDLNFIPVLDNYCPPDANDQRAEPSVPRRQALFQWFEQLWEIGKLKKEAAEKGLDAIWLLWHELSENHNPSDLAGNLNRYLGVGFDETHLVTQFHPGFDLSSSDLLNEEWTIRVWEILKGVEAWRCKFSPHSFQEVRPSEWVNIDFNAKGNENLITFIAQGLTRSAIRQFEKLRIINDQIKTESKLALTSYLESLNSDASFALDDVLLMDSAAGVCDTASRLDIAIGMVQTFLNRINLGIENLDKTAPISFTNKEERLWNARYASFEAWKICKLRACYPENFVIHDVLKEDGKSPGFRFLKENLKKDTLTLPVSGGISKLQANKAPGFTTLTPLQESIPSIIASKPSLLGHPVVSGVKKWESSDAPDQLNFWIETAENLNIPYLRVAAASLPLAGIQFGCRDAACCDSCEEVPLHLVTEYHFFLIKSKCYKEIKQTYQDWESGNNIEELLYMKDKPVSFLAWSKIENGTAGAVQWSPIGIKSEEDPIELIFKGRFQDSLWIEAKNGVSALEELFDSNNDPIPGTGLAPGFRFDLATEEAISLPEIGEQLPDPFGIENDPFYFLYHDLGAPRYPKTLDGTAYLISKQLQANCNFKGAKDWLDHVLDTLNQNNHWSNASDLAAVKRKALLTIYIENLLAWAKHLHEKNTKESLNQAKMVLGLAGKILGERPKEVIGVQSAPVSLNDFSPLHPKINPKLLCLYNEYHSLTEFLTYCLNHQGKNCYSISDSLLNAACHSPVCCDPRKECVPDSPYRFLALINRAKEYANALSALGNSLQSAIEKGDQERLTFLREAQSNQITRLNLETKQNLVREAHFQVKALERTLEITQNRLVHTQNLITVGLIAQEQDYITLTKQSMVAQATSQALNAVAQFVMLLPEVFAPIASDVGGGTKSANALQGGAAVAGAIAGILQTRAQLKNNDAGNFRREQEWVHQLNDVLTIEVKQVKNQLIAAKLRLFNAQKDLDNHQIQIDHSDQTLRYLRDKFSNQEFYQWQEKELCQLYYQLYECALQVSYQAEKAYNIEKCYSNEQFLNVRLWHNAYRGLLAGERLSAALRNMEKKFMDTNHKMYELTKSISLYREAPRTFLMIKYNGTSLVKISEDLFAFDHPSHYCRMYKSISITIPCVVGPYVNVNASMTLKNSLVRVSPRILPVNCSDKKYSDGYRIRENDDRFVYIAGGKDTLATSKAVQDSGYYQLSFQNEQYLTFENAGVEADFCFSLKQSNNRFDTSTVSDIILETSYISKEGGEIYGKAAAEAVKYRLPGNGELLINSPEQFPDHWYEMKSGEKNQYRLELGRQDFPFLSFDADLFICQIELIIEAPPCPECDVMEVVYQNGNCQDCDDVTLICQRSTALGGKAFHGVLNRDFPLSNERAFLGRLCFPKNLEIKNLYLLITYKAIPVVCLKNNDDCC